MIEICGTGIADKTMRQYFILELLCTSVSSTKVKTCLVLFGSYLIWTYPMKYQWEFMI